MHEQHTRHVSSSFSSASNSKHQTRSVHIPAYLLYSPLTAIFTTLTSEARNTSSAPATSLPAGYSKSLHLALQIVAVYILFLYLHSEEIRYEAENNSFCSSRQ